MQVRRLSLTNFRNYSRLELDLPGGSILLHGDNAQGKTNLLEALYLLATTRSPHASQDYQMVNQAALATGDPLVVGRLVAEVIRPDGPVQLEMRLVIENRDGRTTGTPTLRREALINRRKVRLMDLLGQLRVVLFLPEDVDMVTGSPAARRRYMNITLCQVDPNYCRHLSTYNKVLEQRNALLRRMAEGKISAPTAADLLPILTQKLVDPGSHILARRAAFVSAIGRETHRIYYEDLIKQRETIRLSYLPRWRVNGRDSVDEQRADGDWLEQHATESAAAERLDQAFEESQSADVARGSTTVGPHRDDWMVLVNGHSLGDYGSRGQLRTAVLALKLAEINWMKAVTSDVPLLLLDEVIAELDLRRREALLDYVREAVQGGTTGQALLTATDPGMFLPSFLEASTSMLVSGGRVEQDVEEPDDA